MGQCEVQNHLDRRDPWGRCSDCTLTIDGGPDPSSLHCWSIAFPRFNVSLDLLGTTDTQEDSSSTCFHGIDRRLNGSSIHRGSRDRDRPNCRRDPGGGVSSAAWRIRASPLERTRQKEAGQDYGVLDRSRMAGREWMATDRAHRRCLRILISQHTELGDPIHVLG